MRKKMTTLLAAIVVIATLAFAFTTNTGEDMLGKVGIKAKRVNLGDATSTKGNKNSTVANSALESANRPQPKCKRVWVGSVVYSEDNNTLLQSLLDGDSLINNAIGNVEDIIFSLEAWNAAIDVALSNPLVQDIDLVSVAFDNLSPNWEIPHFSVSVITDDAGAYSSFGQSFISHHNVWLITQSPLHLTFDIHLSNGNDYRVASTFAPMGINLDYYADVYGTFDFGDGTVNGQPTLAGNAKEIFGDVSPLVETNVFGDNYDLLYLNLLESPGFQVDSILAVNDAGETSEPTDLITVAILENLLNSAQLGYIFLGEHEAYDNRILSEAQVDTVLNGFKDALGVMVGRQILADYGHFTNKDLVRVHWLEKNYAINNATNAMVCDYGQSVSTYGPVSPVEIKPNKPYVENGVDHNF